MKSFVIVEGDYEHDVVGVYSSLEKAMDAARPMAESELAYNKEKFGHDIHSVCVLEFEVDSVGENAYIKTHTVECQELK